MKMTMRWFGETDSVSLEDIAQVPCMRGIVGTLEDNDFSLENLLAFRQRVEARGLSLDVIESIPVHEAIKLGLSERDFHIDAYCESIRNMGRAGIPVLCYNFMPVFDWMRTDMAVHLPDDSIVSAYDHEMMQEFDPSQGLEARVAWARGFTGEELRAELARYEHIDEAALFENLVYFLRRIIPAAETAGVLLALHPDDPPWSILGLPRIVRDAEGIQRILAISDSPNHGLTFCAGALGTLPKNNLPAMIRQFAARIHFVHMRNVRVTAHQSFHEVAHPSECGDVNMEAVMQALMETGFSGPLRPDHGRRIWGEKTPRAGYGLYDRALGAMYLYGLWKGLEGLAPIRTLLRQ